MIPLAASSAVLSFGLLGLALLVGGWLLGSGERLRWSCALLALIAAPLVLAGSVVGDETSSLPSLSPLLIAGLAGAAALALAALAALFVRWPRAVIPVALATVAFRLPLELGSDMVKLLLPLYATIAAAIIARAFTSWRGARVADLRAPKLLDVAIVLYLVLYALQSFYATDIAVATQNFCFFYVPFALLYGIAVNQPWDAKLLRASITTLVGVALLLVAGGFVEFAQGRYLITIGGAAPSDFDPYFRVQSFFFDPNIYGRFLATVMLLVCAVMLYTKKPRRVGLAAIVLAILWAGLVLSLSQSSIAALLAGLITLAALRWRPKPVLITAAAVLLVGLVFAVAFPSVTGVDLTSGSGAEKTSSGRFDLITGAFSLWGERPLLGHGSGDFSQAYRANELATHTPFGPRVTSKSHTAPLTVAAEQGLIGLAAYLFLLVTAFSAVFRRTRERFSEQRRAGAVARVGVAAAFTAIFVHSLAYAALLEDPLTWLLLGCAVSLAAIPISAPSPEDPA